MLNEDIHNIDFKSELKKIGYKSIDILCGGPPCQGFSTVGSKNKKDKRNSLFWEFLRTVNETNPKVVIFENVAGFKSLYNGQAYETLIYELESIGYRVYSNVLNAADYGLPQHRKRTIVVGIAKDYSFEFPKIIKSKVRDWKTSAVKTGRIKDVEEGPYIIGTKDNFDDFMLYQDISGNEKMMYFKKVSLNV